MKLTFIPPMVPYQTMFLLPKWSTLPYHTRQQDSDTSHVAKLLAAFHFTEVAKSGEHEDPTLYTEF